MGGWVGAGRMGIKTKPGQLGCDWACCHFTTRAGGWMDGCWKNGDKD